MIVMASRCLPSLPDEGDSQWKECFIDGWTVQIKEPMKKEGSFKKEKRRAINSGSGLAGAGHSSPGKENFLNDLKLDKLLHKALKNSDTDWMSASFLLRKNTRPILQQLRKG
eukprot:Tbor_TRINITY_DN6200_c0_g1::TRINITY_DN6200_c0_g1_i11::g.1827::m.1827